ncbi:MAG: cyclic beta 1-2 glucan synthetase [Bacteroidales bacterium]|nr:cyclic beta 1-2 glucan synthetase [Bacteroidales bacterium]
MINAKTGLVPDIFSLLRLRYRNSSSFRNTDNLEPFRSELFSSEQMNQHGEVLARSHKLLKRNSGDQLLKRLDENEKTLLEVRKLLVESIRTGKNIVTPAAEWLLDNFYLIEEQIVISRKHLPKGYSENLPYLANGISAGMPRVYDIVLEIISHSDGRVDIKSLTSFIDAYQKYTVLTLGELWAIPIMLRLAVIENLRRIAVSVAMDLTDQNLADFWADKMMVTLEKEPGNLVLTVADMVRTKPLLEAPFVAAFTRKLQGKGPALALPLSWMEQQLLGVGLNSSDLVRQENHKQAADQVSVRNSIGTLRFLGGMDWQEFVETLSHVEQVLRQDRNGTYSQMDFSTRDSYRHVVETMAKYSPLSETEIAEKVVELAGENTGEDPESKRKEHVGYYLIDKGLKTTEVAVGMRYSLRQRINRMAGRMPVFIYIASILSLTIAITSAVGYYTYSYGVHNWMMLTLVCLLIASGSAQLAVSLVNWLSTILVKPKQLPRMDFSKGIPHECRTLVVVPTMLSGKDYIEELIEALEIRYLSNREENLHFGLLTDFLDADEEHIPGDEELLGLANRRIADLNEKYYQSEQEVFFLLHRPRKWNPREMKWMGYERKRGKLAALNAFILGKSQDEFSLVTGNFRILTNVRYVITLDSDTQMPREAAWKFIATMAHPLNKAIYNEEKRRVTDGYGILQPRVGSGIPKGAQSLYLQIQGDVSGIDPYTRVSSDVYQDLFREGSFIGKGIYDVEIFEQALHQVFQENRILSHDLIEGCYTRSGLISDVLLYDDNPSQYSADIKRHHRWIRGDWQIGAWLMPYITMGTGKMVVNKLSALSKWKIFDNLRRSMLPLTLLLLLLLGLTILPVAGFWIIAVSVILLFTPLAEAGWKVFHKPNDLRFTAHLAEIGDLIKNAIVRFMFTIAVLPYEALKFTDAVLRTNWRLNVTRKKLLEWTPSASASRNARNDLVSSYRSMWIAPFAALACIAFFIYMSPEKLYFASPVIFLWLFTPAISWWFSKPIAEDNPNLTDDQIAFLHKSARKTWSFFEQFVTAEENWLPPDNFQEQPFPVIAHRTSPTNIGLSLLANLSAYDFGYITGNELIVRCRNAMGSLLKMERFRGHFYNWYNTLTLDTLRPRYVSSVDSGNLIGHVLTLKQGILALTDQPVFRRNIFEGFRSTVLIIRDLSKSEPQGTTDTILKLLEKAIQGETLTLTDIKKHLDSLTILAGVLNSQQNAGDTELNTWTNRFLSQIQRIRDDIAELIPWIDLLPAPDEMVLDAESDFIPSFSNIPELAELISHRLDVYELTATGTENRQWIAEMRSRLEIGISQVPDRLTIIGQLAENCERLSTVEYDFLYDKSTRLLSIGYNAEEQRRDNSYYDLLASEARLAVFVGIAQGKLPQESWFALGRLLTNSSGEPILISWSGSMFEYLMPQLVMPTYENTLLYQTNKATLKRQIEYGGQRGVPWGISESAYNEVDAGMNYQYRAFGVPGLGLKRGLEADLVIAPYASMMALMISPAKACSNLQLMTSEGFEGDYGFYEAIDYTTSRQPRGKTHSILYSYMAHHQGMSFLSLAYLLLGKPMQQRFVSELRFQATLLLLQERIPRATIFYAHTADIIETHSPADDVQIRSISSPNTRMPEIQLLSNGNYQAMISNSGAGYSRWKGFAVTRWREDATKEDRGIFCYIKDKGTERIWSNTHQPTLQPAEDYEAVFSQGRIEFRRQDNGFITKTEIVISPEDDTEMRRIRLTNKNLTTRVLEITSYAEVVLASQASDESHPSFSNLFVQTEILPEHKAILCTRRPRSKDEMPPWMFHLMDAHNTVIEDVSYETDRMKFIGRGKSLVNPQAMEVESLSGSQGSVLDPVVAIRYRISMKPNQTAIIDMIYGISESREGCEALMHKYQDRYLKKRAFELSWTHSQVLLRQIKATEADAQLFNRMAASVVFANPELRAETSVIQINNRGQSGLWSHSVSGDLPIVLLRVYEPDNVDLVKQMIQAHTYWRLKGLAVDLVIWNEDYGAYRQMLQDQILGFITTEAYSNQGINQPGNIYVKSADQLSTEDRVLFESVARIIIFDNKGSLADQVGRFVIDKPLVPSFDIKPNTFRELKSNLALPDDLLFFNGMGGFTPDGKEYKIIINKNKTTQAPWANVIANPEFGTVISESGSAYTWALNAHEYRLSPWSNDPVTDAGGEAFYIRDEETGSFWSPAPYPKSGTTPYIVTHGFGYSVFEHAESGIFSEMRVFVDKEKPVKFIILKVKNRSGRERKLSATGYIEMILGDVRSKTNMHIVSEQEPETGALLFRNKYNSAFSDRVTFFRVEAISPGFSTDRSVFIGRNRSLEDPQAMSRKTLSGRIGARLDPCGALQVKYDLLDGEEKEIVFQLGNASDTQAVMALIHHFSRKEHVLQSLFAVKEYWNETLGAVQVTTPDDSLNILANGWLSYQTLACRIFARSGFYQSGGAFGFRDQLQDVLSLLFSKPEIARSQILLSASRQFAEGDVQHWWHPPEGRGVRTRCSDDLLWLPFVVTRYVAVTGDKDLLDVPVGFLEGRLLRLDEDSLYDLPVNTTLSASLYEHCVRAIKFSLSFGEHGLPFIGSGDWNDGMDQVGNKGKGESVWLAFFLYDVLIGFIDLAKQSGDLSFAETCAKEAEILRQNIESSAWDGEWYKRAWFDDGTPLGSHVNTECRIDAIAQSWSVLSGAADDHHKTIAMASLDKYLVKRDMKLIQLLDPPFDQDGLNPGYIKGYVPGVRENGGQYTHAAIWALMALATLGDREKVWELYRMINPISHSSNPEDVKVYKVEPYVMAADVYANKSHEGRGGWTWYTGSAGWMYQFIIYSFLGLEKQADKLTFKPCFPKEWPSVYITYKYGNSTWKITVYQETSGEGSWWKSSSGKGLGDSILLFDDGMEHEVEMHVKIKG